MKPSDEFEPAPIARLSPVQLKDVVDRRFQLWLQRLTYRAYDSRDAVLQRGLDAAVSVASADYANIQLVHPGGKGLEIKAQRGFRDEFLDFFAIVDDQHTACGLAQVERRQIVVDDIASSPIFAGTTGRDVLLDAGVRACTSTPLVGNGGRLLGMLSVHYADVRATADTELNRLRTLADVIGACIEGTAGR